MVTSFALTYLTTAIGQAYIVSDTIENDFNNIEMKKRPKVDVHHFNLTDKLVETGLNVDAYDVDNHKDDASTWYRYVITTQSITIEDRAAAGNHRSS